MLEVTVLAERFDRLDRLDRLGADIAEPVRAAPPDARGVREAVVPIESIPHAAGQLLGFADEIEVLAPVALRTELAALARSQRAPHRSRTYGYSGGGRPKRGFGARRRVDAYSARPASKGHVRSPPWPPSKFLRRIPSRS